MLITVDLIKSKNPCKSRFDNFLNHYPNFEGDLVTFLSLENITYSDKVWVACRILSKNQLVKWSIMCAESVRHIYENKYPDSKVLSDLFDYLNSISDFNNLTEDQKIKIRELRKAAAYAADAAAAYAAYAADAAREEQNNLNLLLLCSLEEENPKEEV